MSNRSLSLIQGLLERNRNLHYENKKLEGMVYRLEKERQLADVAQMERKNRALKDKILRQYEFIGELQEKIRLLDF